jgi:hypothetical protein
LAKATAVHLPGDVFAAVIGASRERRVYFSTNLIMMKRFKLAMQLLFGGPVRELQISEAVPLNVADAPGFDCTKHPPSGLVMGGLAEEKPPVEIFCEGRFRVCIFSGKSEESADPCRWLVLELETAIGWSQVMSMHEARLATMIGVLHDVGDYLDGYRVAGENLCKTRDLPRRPRRQTE